MKKTFVLCALAAWAGVLSAQIRPPKPGFNLFSPQQDIQLGKEAAAQVSRQMTIVHNGDVDSYIKTLGQKLMRSQYAGNFPYTYQVVADPNINAFSLPGGPVFVNTGLFAAAENEAQLVGVLAHEMSHVALRHGTNQASKANLVQIPAMLLGSMAGGSLLGQLAQLGVGLGANSVLLKFSRTDESQADYLGALMMADAGYNPIEMARFFEKLEAQGGRQGGLSQFLSDHPNPGNRVKAVEDEIRQMPSRQYANSETGQFQNIKDVVRHLPGPRQLRSSYADQHPQGPPSIRPSARFKQYQTNAYSISYPDNWQAFGDQNSPAVTVAPREALFQGANGATQVGYGVMVSYYLPPGDQLDLRRDTANLIAQLQQQNSSLRQRGQRNVTVDGQPAILTTINSQSPYQGETEVDALVTVARPEGLFYLIYIAPQSEWTQVERVFEQMLGSVRFRQSS